MSLENSLLLGLGTGVVEHEKQRAEEIIASVKLVGSEEIEKFYNSIKQLDVKSTEYIVIDSLTAEGVLE